MRLTQLKGTTWLFGTIALGALAASAGSAIAGGFEVREQSAFFQGTSFAGAAAGGSSLSSIFWNPAAGTFVGRGITTDSSYTLVLPEMNIEATGASFDGGATIVDPEFVAFAGFATGNETRSVDFGRDAIVPASYAAYRLNEKTVLTVSMNSPFGLTTKPDNINWIGEAYARTSKVFSLNITPGVAYEIMPGVSIGAGVQVQYFELMKLKSTLAVLEEADDIGVGATAGINITPFRGTSIGLGYRSRIEHDVEGKFDPKLLAGIGFVDSSASASLDTPDKVTLSIRHELGSAMRLLGTVEWTNWSTLSGDIPIVLGGTNPDGSLPFGWEDGWLYALGGEYDFSPKLTLRAGLAYEESPIQEAEARLIQLPDNNRVWASIGATYNYSESTKINVAYSHVWVEDGKFARDSFAGELGPRLYGVAEDNGADIISVGLTMKMDDLFGRRSEAVPLK